MSTIGDILINDSGNPVIPYAMEESLIMDGNQCDDWWHSMDPAKPGLFYSYATDPGDITETVALGTLTHDVLKTKINALLAAMRVAGFFT